MYQMRGMSRRDFLVTTGVVLGTSVIGEINSPALGKDDKGDPPNILLIMCDQLTADVLDCYGGPVSAPNIRRIADEGVVFSQATCVTPFCSPTRASLITGVYPHTHGIVSNVGRRQEGIKVDDVTTQKMLHAQGYQTHQYGKWHLLGDILPYFPDMSFEKSYAERMAPIFEETRKLPPDQWMKWYNWALPVKVYEPLKKAADALGDRWKDAIYSEFITQMGRLELPLEQTFDAVLGDRVVKCLQNLGEAPFMVTCSFNLPHDPNVVPSPYYEMYSPESIQLPDNFNVREQRFEKQWAREIVAALGEVGAREFLRIYYASVKLIDDQVGRVLDALEATGRAENTIIVFTADHGDMAGGHGMVWKSTTAFYDEIVRVPLIIRHPTQVRPGRMDIVAESTDIMPTLLDFAGLPIPDHVQGHSLAPFLRRERDPAEAPAHAFCERVNRNRDGSRTVAPGTPASLMIRGRGWKYIRYPDGEEFLYDLKNDPGETSNLAADASSQERKAELQCELDAWLVATGYPGKE